MYGHCKIRYYDVVLLTRLTFGLQQDYLLVSVQLLIYTHPVMVYIVRSYG